VGRFVLSLFQHFAAHWQLLMTKKAQGTLKTPRGAWAKKGGKQLQLFDCAPATSLFHFKRLKNDQLSPKSICSLISQSAIKSSHEGL
jgi:hypothetical protein